MAPDSLSGHASCPASCFAPSPLLPVCVSFFPKRPFSTRALPLHPSQQRSNVSPQMPSQLLVRTSGHPFWDSQNITAALRPPLAHCLFLSPRFPFVTTFYRLRPDTGQAVGRHSLNALKASIREGSDRNPIMDHSYHRTFHTQSKHLFPISSNTVKGGRLPAQRVFGLALNLHPRP